MLLLDTALEKNLHLSLIFSVQMSQMTVLMAQEKLNKNPLKKKKKERKARGHFKLTGRCYIYFLMGIQLTW